jgi:hypothetical protein
MAQVAADRVRRVDVDWCHSHASEMIDLGVNLLALA